MKIPIYSLVAYSGTGKTTLMVGLIKELKRRKVRVAALKHDAHHFKIDQEGKDSYKMSEAGSDITVISSAEKCAIIENRPVSMDCLLEKIKDVDIILTEGYTHGNWKKIGIYRKGSGNPLRIKTEDCFVLCTNQDIKCSCKTFSLEDYSGLADYLLEDMKFYKSL